MEFIAKWKKAELKERSAAQEHFIDLCRVFAHPTPAEADPTGETFCFEKGASKQGGGEGFADVWKKDFFGWEYKGKHKDLATAYDQLLLYRDALASPPLLVVCDLDRIIVHTNFTKTVSVTHEIALDQLGEPRSLEIMRAVFFEPEKLRPGKTSEVITRAVAEQFAGIAESIRKRGLDSGKVAHFLNRLVFCLFAEDIGLLPDMIFTRIVEKSGGDPQRFGLLIRQLFEAMANGGDFGLDTIRHFNGNLFDDASVIEMTEDEVKQVVAASRLDWSAVDPSIFGTLFERGLDPAKRSQLGAHYTSREDIETLVEPVVMQPLRREWDEAKKIVETLLISGQKKADKSTAKKLSPGAERKARGEADSILHRFLAGLHNVKVLDPACGSGNFLYVTLQKLKDLEKEVILYGMEKGFGGYLPMVGPWQLYGIEINPYAHDLAQMTVWIGFLQWTRANGFQVTQDPILRPMAGNFRCMDAIMDLSDPANPKEPEWPKIDFIVGNPPFLGGKMLRRELGDEYMDKLFGVWKDHVPHEADLCCYWFEKARSHIEKDNCKRAGLLATQGIRGGTNREVLKRIKKSGDIFWAISDKDWILDGANLHVSLIAFDGGEEKTRIIDNRPVGTINANLTSAVDITQADSLADNLNIAFMGTTKGGGFDIEETKAIAFLRSPNPHGRPNSDVVVPWVNGMDLTQRPKGKWIIDYGVGMPNDEAAKYEAVFEYIRVEIKPDREKNARESYRRLWWQHVEARPAMREVIAPLSRFLCTCRVSKHRLFVWLRVPTLPDSATFAFSRSDDFFFGVLQSRLHDLWALAQGTVLGGNTPRYTPTTCFETFPMPMPTPEQEAAIAEAARELNELRERWLNPPEWMREEILEFLGTVGGPWDRYIDKATVDSKTNIGLVRYPRIVPKDEESASQLQKRTLTK
ncbi:MAG: N-6 DNA methylase, partial [Kiritimatiellae bacterium]|nr:N-6 DNA methylase [Kiritimatiellia bacterium]